MKNKNRASMVHCSFDTVTEFIPRIPKQRVEGMFTEDDKIKRICVAPTVQQALQGIPQSGIVMETMKELKLPIIVHAYYLKGGFFYNPTEEQVPDVSVTGEHWLLQNPDSVYRRDYEVTDFLTRRLKDMNGKEEPFLIGAQIKTGEVSRKWSQFCKKIPVK